MSSPSSILDITNIKSAVHYYPPLDSGKFTKTVPILEPITTSNPLEPEFYLDGLTSELKALLDENDWLKDDAVLPPIPNLYEVSLKIAQDLLITPRIFKIPHSQGNFEISLSLKMIIQFLNSQKEIGLEIKNQIVGGYLQKLLGSKWFIDAIGKLIGEEKVKKWINPESLSYIDSKKCDIDLRHISIKEEINARFDLTNQSKPASEGKCGVQIHLQDQLQTVLEQVAKNANDPGLLAEKLVKFVAGKIPKNTYHYTEEQICNFIRNEGSIFKEFHSLFWIDPKPNGKVENNLFLVSFSDFDGMDIDLVIATVIEKIALITTQDFSLDIDQLLDNDVQISGFKLTPTGKSRKGWQAIIDIVCKVIHFQSLTGKALIKAASLMAKQFRCGGPFPKEVFEDLWRYCKNSGRPSASAIAYLLKSEIKQHHANNPNAAVAFTFNLCTVLFQNGFAGDTLTDVWKEINKPNPKGPPLNPMPTGKFAAIKKAAESLPFDFVAALVDIRIFLSWSVNTKGASEITYLRQHASENHLMTVIEDLSIYTNSNPEQALKTISKHCRQCNDNPHNPAIMEAACVLLNALMPDTPYCFENASIHKYKKQINLNLFNLEACGKLLTVMPQKEFKILGWEILILKETKEVTQNTFASFIEWLPEIMSCASSPQFQQALWNFLEFLCKDNKNEKGGIALRAIFPKIIALLKDKQPPKGKFYEYWLLELSASQNKFLCESAYKIWSSYFKTCKITEEAEFYKSIVSNLILVYPEYSLRIYLDLLKANLAPFTNDFSIFEKVLQAFASACSMPCQFDVTLLESFVEEMLEKNPLQMKLIKDRFFAISKELLSANAKAGYKLLSYSCRGKQLVIKDAEAAASLWLHCCEAFFPLTPVMDVYNIWQEAAELKIWKPNTDYKEHRAFITAFICQLYALDNADADALGHQLLPLISNHPFKDGLSSKIENLCMQREKKLMKDKESQEELMQSQKQLESYLDASSDPGKISVMKSMSIELIVKLCKKIPDAPTYTANLMQAKKLLENPKVHRLFDNLEDLRELLLRLLDLTFHSKMPRLSNNATLTLLETFFSAALPDTQLPETPTILGFSKLLVNALNKSELNFSHKLQAEVTRRQIAVMTIFKLFNLPEFQCLFFKVLIHNNFKNTVDPSAFNEFVLSPLLQLLEKRPSKPEEISLGKECLILIEQKKCVAPDTFQSRYVGTYIALVSQLIHHGMLMEAIPWINRILVMGSNVPNNSIPQLFLEWGAHLGQKKYFTLAMQLFKNAQFQNNNLLVQVVEAVLDLPDEILESEPESYVQTLLEGQKSALKPATYEILSKKIHSLVHKFIKAGITSTNAQLIIRFYEPLPKPPNLPYAPILKAISELKAKHLKIRFLDSFQKHTSFLKSQSTELDNNDLWEDWLMGWQPSLKILQDLWADTKDVKYKNGIVNELDMFLDKKSQAASFWSEHTYEEMQAKTLSKLLFCCMAMVGDDRKDQELLKKLINGCDIFNKYKKEKETCNKIRLGLIEKISNTSNRILFLHGCMYMDLLFREAAKIDFKELFTHLCEYVKHSKQFDKESEQDIFKSLDYIIDHVNDFLLEREDYLKFSKAVIPVSDRLPSADKFIIYTKMYYDNAIFGKGPVPRRFAAKQMNAFRKCAFMAILFLYLANQFYNKRLDLKDAGIALGVTALIWSGLIDRKF